MEQAISNYAGFLGEHVDLEAIRAVAQGRNAPKVGRLVRPPAQRIALARDAAFSFTYPHLLKAWRSEGAEILPFSPLNDDLVPDADLVWLPGGYPELHAGTLAGANRFLTSLRKHAATKPVHGECGGYMALGTTLIDKDGVAHKMAGLLGVVTSYEKRKFHLGYRQAVLQEAVLGYQRGSRLRGHEFHYSTILEEPDAPLAQVTDADGNLVSETGSLRGHVSGTFFHMISEATE